uniref:helix-turn-helix transcriptional regulator n=1 Tax=uncultured Leifsonia sp. TaxID=340359 RepID=UPI0028D55790
APETAAAWDDAAVAAEDTVAPAHLRPYALIRAARVALLAGDRQRAERLADTGRRDAERFGFGLLVAAADELGLARGHRAAGTAVPGAAAPLTEREEQVLALIEQGLSNKQIGERLFISAKTASVHVSSILRKVGASTRTEAVYRASRPSA